MTLPRDVLQTLTETPDRFESVFQLFPESQWNRKPSDWEGVPGERFTALEQLWHLRDIEIDGYHLRIRRMLDESEPDLVSLDGYRLAEERSYATRSPLSALAEFRQARAGTLRLVSGLDAQQLERKGTFAEYGSISLAGLIHLLCSHDLQHQASMHWLLAKLAA